MSTITRKAVPGENLAKLEIRRHLQILGVMLLYLLRGNLSGPGIHVHVELTPGVLIRLDVVVESLLGGRVHLVHHRKQTSSC